MLMGGGSDSRDDSSRLGLPVDLIEESEGHRYSGSEIYPDNALTVSVFADIKTQWRVGTSGVIGLDYNVLPFVYKIREVKMSDRADVFEGIQIMERAAMKTIRSGK